MVSTQHAPYFFTVYHATGFTYASVGTSCVGSLHISSKFVCCRLCLAVNFNILVHGAIGLMKSNPSYPLPLLSAAFETKTASARLQRASLCVIVIVVDSRRHPTHDLSVAVTSHVLHGCRASLTETDTLAKVYSRNLHLHRMMMSTTLSFPTFSMPYTDCRRPFALYCCSVPHHSKRSRYPCRRMTWRTGFGA